MSLREGLEWTVYDTPIALEEVTAPSIIEDNTLKIYAKDKAGVSALYYEDDAEVEHDLSGGFTGSGTANRLAYWTGATVLAANAALTFHRVLVADVNGLPANNGALTLGQVVVPDSNGELTGESGLFWDATNKRLGIGTNTPGISAAAGRNYITVIGSTIGGVYEMGTNQADADGNFVGLLQWADKNSTLASKNRAAVIGALEGTTANQRGGNIRFYTAGDTVSALSERFRVGSLGQLGIGGATYGSANDVFKSGGASAAPSWVAPAAVTAASSKITLAGSPSTAGLAAFSIDVNQANLDHGSIGGLADDDHTQYALLAGRSGGQTLIGDTAASGDLTLQSTAHATRGTIKIIDILNSNTERSLLIGTVNTVSFFTNAPTITEIGGTTTNNTVGTSALLLTTILNGSADHALGLWINPTFQPSASIGVVRGIFNTPIFNPGTGVTLSGARVSEYTGVTGDGAGVITILEGLHIGSPTLGTLKPATINGLIVNNQGATGITTAIGIKVIAQSGATNNYDMEFTRNDTTAAGTYHGRIPVLYNGALKYLHAFNA